MINGYWFMAHGSRGIMYQALSRNTDSHPCTSPPLGGHEWHLKRILLVGTVKPSLGKYLSIHLILWKRYETQCTQGVSVTRSRALRSGCLTWACSFGRLFKRHERDRIQALRSECIAGPLWEQWRRRRP